MGDKENKNTISGNSIIDAISTENFTNLSEETQQHVINSIGNSTENGGGIMGKFFGSKKEIASMNIAFTVCILLTIIGVICMCSGNECWNIIVTGIMTTVGYIFGRGSKD